MKQDSDVVAAKRWQKYMDSKVSMLIRQKPDDFECGGQFIVVPNESKNFVMNSFSTVSGAKVWCTQNGLTATEAL